MAHSANSALGGHLTSVAHTITIEDQIELVIDSKDIAADGVADLTLRRPNRAELPVWTAGAHIDVNLPNSLTRQYSLCGYPDDVNSYRIAVLRESESRGGSEFIHRSLQTGHTIGIKGPRNNFPLLPAPNYLFIAGGIGITPILPMLSAVEGRRANWTLLYGGRHRSSMAFLNELESYADRVTVAPQDEVGLLNITDLLREPRPDTLVYCCGPEPLLSAVESQCAAAWPSGFLNVERFKAIDRGQLTDQPFEVELRRAGTRLTVPVGKTILETIEETGTIVDHSCREGICGTCEIAVIDGIPDHRDSVLSRSLKDSNKAIMICVSRSKSKLLILDL
jgi:ferredoxin-NADP reductase